MADSTTGVGTWISGDDFLMAVAALHPTTPHSGAWMRVRNSAIYRYYAANSKQLASKQAEQLCQDLVNSDLEAARKLTKHHIASDPTIQGDVPGDKRLTASVCTAVLLHVLMQGGLSLSKSMFDRALSLKVIPQPVKLLRLRLG